MLKTDFLGIKLDNPVIVAAGPWNRDGNSIKASLASGAGAVVTESIVSDAIMDVRPRIAADSMGAQNIRLYSDIQIEGWEREMNIAKSDGGVVIASISGHSPSEVAYMASKMEKFGADGIELSVSNPAVESLEVVASDADTIYEMTKAVVSAVTIPVTVKLSQNTTNIAKVAKAVKAADGSGVTAINTVRGILGVDTDTAKPTLSTYGGISGEYIRPLGLASVATIAQTVDIPISGVGGISTAKHALEYMMLGASVVQIGTAFVTEGYDIIRKIVQELEIWGQDHNLKNISEIKGKALDNLKSFEEMKYEPSVSIVNGTLCTENCSKCIDLCLYGAVTRTSGKINVDRGKCTGCGLCTSICPANKLKLGW
ncbi:MAG: tRNA-dihydrouridine synthase [Firmicutes bacterium]|nr:tRNA-dihydrouridine synthase [Bacillota bacterium]